MTKTMRRVMPVCVSFVVAFSTATTVGAQDAERPVLVWSVGATKLPRKLRKKMPSAIEIAVDADATWQLIQPDKKQRRKLQQLGRKCARDPDIECVEKAAALVGAKYVMVAAFAREKKEVAIVLSVADAEAGETMASVETTVTVSAWEEGVTELVGQLLVAPGVAPAPAEEPGAEEPGAEEPVAEKPGAEEPVGEGPPPPESLEEPAGEATADSQPDAAAGSVEVAASEPTVDAVPPSPDETADVAEVTHETPVDSEPEEIAAASVEPVVDAPVETEPEPPTESTEVFPYTAGVEIGASFSQVLSKLGTSLSLTVEVGYILPVLDQKLEIFADLSYVKPKHRSEVNDPRLDGGSFSFSIREEELLASAGVLYRWFEPGTAINPYGQLGYRLRLQHANVRGKDGEARFGENDETTTEPAGMVAALGIEISLPFMPGALAAEIVFSIGDLAHRVTGNSSAGGLALQAGYHALF